MVRGRRKDTLPGRSVSAALVGQSSRRARRPPITSCPEPAAVIAFRAAAPTVRLVLIFGSTPRADRYRNPLYHAAVVVSNGVLSIVDREVPADQISSHGSVLACEIVGLVVGSRLVFAVVDADNACVAGTGAV